MSQLHLNPTEEESTFLLSGKIAADVDFSPLLQEPHSHLILRFAEINEITSVGIKKWIEGICALQRSDKSVELRNCPEIFVEQCNLVPEITQDVTIHSFETIFFCEDCNKEEPRFLKTEELDRDNLSPLVKCPSCQEEMITEDADAFKFITHHGL